MADYACWPEEAWTILRSRPSRAARSVRRTHDCWGSSRSSTPPRGPPRSPARPTRRKPKHCPQARSPRLRARLHT
ncbi:hypothetical protein [Streptomyces chartreusis]